MSYTADIEVLNEAVFNKLCPGKAEFIGYNEWKKRLKDAAEVFGKGHVNTGLVTGTELAPEIGFKTEDAAFYAMSEEAEELAEAGVGVAITVWQPSPISILKNSKNPSLEYYARLTQEFERIRLKYNLSVDFDDYRRCGNHCNTDLARLR
jgi:biotin synthase-related radical SAM superfamily protein